MKQMHFIFLLSLSLSDSVLVSTHNTLWFKVALRFVFCSSSFYMLARPICVESSGKKINIFKEYGNFRRRLRIPHTIAFYKKKKKHRIILNRFWNWNPSNVPSAITWEASKCVNISIHFMEVYGLYNFFFDDSNIGQTKKNAFNVLAASKTIL